MNENYTWDHLHSAKRKNLSGDWPQKNLRCYRKSSKIKWQILTAKQVVIASENQHPKFIWTYANAN